MRHKLKGAPKLRRKRESFIRLRPDGSSTLDPQMGRPVDTGHLRAEQIDRAQEVVTMLKEKFGNLSALERASTAVGHGRQPPSGYA